MCSLAGDCAERLASSHVPRVPAPAYELDTVVAEFFTLVCPLAGVAEPAEPGCRCCWGGGTLMCGCGRCCERKKVMSSCKVRICWRCAAIASSRSLSLASSFARYSALSWRNCCIQPATISCCCCASRMRWSSISSFSKSSGNPCSRTPDARGPCRVSLCPLSPPSPPRAPETSPPPPHYRRWQAPRQPLRVLAHLDSMHLGCGLNYAPHLGFWVHSAGQ